jgi:esterase/lipase superfamily enzyme
VSGHNLKHLFAGAVIACVSGWLLRRRRLQSEAPMAREPTRVCRWARSTKRVTVFVLAFAAQLAGCGDGETMFPAPILLKDPRLDFARFVAPKHHTTDVRVFYATTRAPAPDGYAERYSRKRGDAVRLGVAQVELGEPGWSFADLVESDRNSRIDALRPARVTSVEEFGVMGSDAEQSFIAGIDRQVRTSRTGEAVIYVPGYRVTFDQVMVLMGTWAHYLGRSSSVVAFSWPTGTSVWNYLLDCPRARAFVPDIARLVELVADRSQARRINLIGFSCGSPLLAEALVALRDRHPEEDHDALQRRYRIANAIFVAADIDLETFARSHLPALSDVARRTEVYVSENDGALRFAALLSGASRLGRPRFDELTREDLKTLASNERLVGIDVADVYGAHELRGMRGHGYWVANERVSSDVLLSMIYPFDPAWRGLVHAPGRSMWTFPEDYPRRVGDAVYEAAPELRRERTPGAAPADRG